MGVDDPQDMRDMGMGGRVGDKPAQERVDVLQQLVTVLDGAPCPRGRSKSRSDGGEWGAGIAVGNAGWVGVGGIGLPGVLYVRARDAGGRLRIAELYLDASEGPAIEGADVRDLPLGQIEALLNWTADHIRERMDVPGPDLSTLASYFAAMPWKRPKQAAVDDWVTSAFLSQQLPAGRRTGTTDGVPVMRVPRLTLPPFHGIRQSDREFRLSAGPAEGLTDDFLHEVARAYNAALARGERPNVAIAKQTNYPLRTVQRWVYTARQRRIMPPGRPGRVG